MYTPSALSEPNSPHSTGQLSLSIMDVTEYLRSFLRLVRSQPGMMILCLPDLHKLFALSDLEGNLKIAWTSLLPNLVRCQEMPRVSASEEDADVGQGAASSTIEEERGADKSRIYRVDSTMT
jgi:hypothetical protein